ncbi:MAG: hypothetical protein VYD59_00045 [Bacteroidota bacterium]|nr:hypothetical protein [Bacteroidota bacterium]
MAIQIVISLYTTRVILNVLGVSDFGIYNLLSGAVAMFGFFRAALSSSTIRFLAFSEGKGNSNEKTKIFNISIVLHLLLAVLFFVLLEIGLNFFFNSIFNIDPTRVETAKLVSHFVIVISCINILIVPFEGVLNSHENMFYLSIVDLARSILVLVLATLMTYTQADKLYFYGASLLIIWIIVFGSYAVYCFKKYEECIINFKELFDKNLAKSMLNFSSLEFFGYSTGIISLYCTNLFINSFFGTVVNAAQGIANQISAQLTSFSTTMMKAVKPALVKGEGSGNYDFVQKATFLSGKYSFLILIFFATPFLLETNYIMNLWLKNVPEWAIIFCRLQIIKNCIEQFFLPFGTAIGARGNIKNYVIANSINNLMIIPCIYLFFSAGLPPYSMYIILIVFFSIFGFIINMYYSKLLLDFNISHFLRKIVIPNFTFYLLIILLCSIIVYFLEESFLRFVFVTVVSSVSIISMAYLLMTNEEKNKVLMLIRK